MKRGSAGLRRFQARAITGVFATLDAGAPKTFGVYFMYDVKQADPAEWTSPPFEAALVDMPGFGKIVMGRGAVNQKGPQSAFIAALHAFKAAGRKLPVNLVFVAEGEEEIGSPYFPQIVHKPEVMTPLRGCKGLFMPMPTQSPDGTITIALGAKGVIELELVSVESVGGAVRSGISIRATRPASIVPLGV